MDDPPRQVFHECKVSIKETVINEGNIEHDIVFYSTNQNQEEFEKYMGVAFGHSTKTLDMLRRILKQARSYYDESFTKEAGY